MAHGRRQRSEQRAQYLQETADMIRMKSDALLVCEIEPWLGGCMGRVQ